MWGREALCTRQGGEGKSGRREEGHSALDREVEKLCTGGGSG